MISAGKTSRNRVLFGSTAQGPLGCLLASKMECLPRNMVLEKRLSAIRRLVAESAAENSGDPDSKS